MWSRGLSTGGGWDGGIGGGRGGESGERPSLDRIRGRWLVPNPSWLLHYTTPQLHSSQLIPPVSGLSVWAISDPPQLPRVEPQAQELQNSVGPSQFPPSGLMGWGLGTGASRLLCPSRLHARTSPRRVPFPCTKDGGGVTLETRVGGWGWGWDWGQCGARVGHRASPAASTRPFPTPLLSPHLHLRPSALPRHCANTHTHSPPHFAPSSMHPASPHAPPRHSIPSHPPLPPRYHGPGAGWPSLERETP